MTKQRFLAIIYLLIGIILPAMAQTFTEQKKTYPVSADGSKYVVSGFTSFSPASDEHIYANALLWTCNEESHRHGETATGEESVAQGDNG